MRSKQFGLAALAGTFLAGASVLAYAQTGGGGGAAGGAGGGGTSAPPAAGAPAAGGGAGAPAAGTGATTTQSPTGQGSRTEGTPGRATTGQPAQGSPTQSTQGSRNTNTGAGAPAGSSGGTGNVAATGNPTVNLTSQQKTEIRQTVINNSGAPRVTNVNFGIRVGVAVPAEVRVAPLPATIVEIHPAWRGYSYFVYKEEIIIIDPRTRHIVAVLVV